jgi:hypothetical protein
MDLTEEQWAVVGPLIGTIPPRADGHGKTWRSSRHLGCILILLGEEFVS